MVLPYIVCQLLIAQVALPPTTERVEELLDEYRPAAVERWTEEIARLEPLDQDEQQSERAILLVGSSSIRLWETAAEDLAPWPTIRRGYGGARLSDLIVFTDRLVSPLDFQALVLFVANDISGGSSDKTPEQVLELFQAFVQLVRRSHPDHPIFFITITPTSSRFHVWEHSQRANQLIGDYCQSDSSLHVIDTTAHFLNDRHEPKDELFRDDRLHLNRQGYQLWARLIQAALAETL